MKVLSLNVGSEREVEDASGAKINTSFYKSPVDGRVWLRARGLDGDMQTDGDVHGGFDRAAYVYSWDNYAVWREELDGEDFTHGQFGENFTVEGMLDGEVHIGDIFRVGAAVVEVTHGRIPCHKLGLRFGDPEFPKTFLKSLRTGFFLRVMEEGEVGAGDQFQRMALGPERMCVKEAVDLLYGDQADPVRLEILAGLRALTQPWAERARKRLAGS